MELIIGTTFRLIVLFGVIIMVHSGARPRFLKKPTTKYEVSVGDTVKLKCQVTGVNDPLHNRTYTAWKKFEGATTVLVGWPRGPTWRRYRIKNGKHLKIANVEAKDGGKYTCLANNPFGTAVVNIRLIVRVPSKNGTVVYNPTFLSSTPSSSTKASNNPPVFRRNGISFHYTRSKGESLKLRCHANGNPRPKIKWLKNNKLLRRLQRTRLTRWALHFNHLFASDRGRYICVVWNQYGSVNKTFDLQVIPTKPIRSFSPPLKGLPVIQKHLLRNITAQRGDDVTFTCTAISEFPPRFNWLKWSTAEDQTNDTVQVKVMNSSEPKVRFIHEKGRKYHCHKLKLLNVTDSDQGQYTCVVGSGAGFVSSNAFLVVLPRHSGGREDEEQTNTSNIKTTVSNEILIPLAALIGVPVAFGILLIVAIVWCYVQTVRHRARQEMKSKTISFAVDDVSNRQKVEAYKQRTENGISLQRLGTEDYQPNRERQITIHNGETLFPLRNSTGNSYVEHQTGMGIWESPFNSCPPEENYVDVDLRESGSTLERTQFNTHSDSDSVDHNARDSVV